MLGLKLLWMNQEYFAELIIVRPLFLFLFDLMFDCFIAEEHKVSADHMIL